MLQAWIESCVLACFYPQGLRRIKKNKARYHQELAKKTRQLNFVQRPEHRNLDTQSPITLQPLGSVGRERNVLRKKSMRGRVTHVGGGSSWKHEELQNFFKCCEVFSCLMLRRYVYPLGLSALRNSISDISPHHRESKSFWYVPQSLKAFWTNQKGLVTQGKYLKSKRLHGSRCTHSSKHPTPIDLPMSTRITGLNKHPQINENQSSLI